MAENDIYNNKKRYDNFIKNIPNLINKNVRSKYYCINKNNLKYFNRLISSFDVDDLSYIRRLRVLNSFSSNWIESLVKSLEYTLNSTNLVYFIIAIFETKNTKPILHVNIRDKFW